MGQTGSSAGWQNVQAGALETTPRVRLETNSDARWGCRSGEARYKRLVVGRGSRICFTREQCPRRRQANAGPWGAREARCGAGCHAAPEAHAVGSGYRQEERPRKTGAPLTAFAGSDDARVGVSDCGAVKPLSTQIVSNFRRKLSSPTAVPSGIAVVNAFREYEGLWRLATAKLWRREDVLRVAHPPICVNVR
jgi:hypothetical protein